MLDREGRAPRSSGRADSVQARSYASRTARASGLPDEAQTPADDKVEVQSDAPFDLGSVQQTRGICTIATCFDQTIRARRRRTRRPMRRRRARGLCPQRSWRRIGGRRRIGDGAAFPRSAGHMTRRDGQRIEPLEGFAASRTRILHDRVVEGRVSAQVVLASDW